MTVTPDAVILSGGFGLRLREVVGDVPKPMASIAGRPFLELLLKQLKRHAFARVILSVGYKHEVIRDHFGEKAFGMELVYSIESLPLGTGGALRQALRHVTTDAVLVMNGDSYTDADLGGVVRDQEQKNADIVAVVIPEVRSDGGSVVLDHNGRIKAFAEKRSMPGSRYLSAGIYGVNTELLATIPEATKISLEEHLFPRWLEEGKRLEASIFEGKCLDIGTPERYQRAQEDLRKVELDPIFESEVEL